MTPAFVAPDAAEVPSLMQELIAWLNEGDLEAHVLVRAAKAHLNLVSIHPWRDGNGRMSRCLQTLVIARGGRLASEFCSIEEWLGHDINTLDYYRILRETGQGSHQPTRSAHWWIRFCLRAHHLQAQLVARRLQHGREVWAATEMLVRQLGLNDRLSRRSILLPSVSCAAIRISKKRAFHAIKPCGISVGSSSLAW